MQPMPTNQINFQRIYFQAVRLAAVRVGLIAFSLNNLLIYINKT